MSRSIQQTVSVAGLIALSAMAPAAGQDLQDPFDVIIPHATPPGASALTKPGCESAVEGVATTAHGFRFAEVSVPAGRVVESVDRGGPADGVLREGDVVVSLNGHEVVPANRHSAIIDPFSRFNAERGLYVYGLRDDRPFQALVWHCAYPEPRNRFSSGRGQYSFHRLFPQHDQAALADPGMDQRMILAAFVWATSGQRGGNNTGNDFAPAPEVYCRLQDRVEFEYTETITTYESYYGITNKTGEETQERVILMDPRFLPRYRAGFEYVHNDAKTATRMAANSLRAFIQDEGCASPEFKALERAIYGMVGIRWGHGPLFSPGHDEFR